MYSVHDISACFDSNTVSYIKNKNRGGINNQKGNTYELRFALLKVCESSNLFFTRQENPKLCSQNFCFIDDFAVQRGSSISNFQIKDVQTLSWNSGPHPLENDCRNQLRLNTKMGFSNSIIQIIVSRTDVANSLSRCNPFSKEPVEIVHFEFHPKLDHYLYDQRFAEGLSLLSPRRNPDNADLDHILTLVAGEWAKLTNSCTDFQDFYCLLKRNRHNWVNRGQCDINDPDLESILSGIAGFSYNCQKGYFEWEYSPHGYSLEDGCFKEPCDSDEFLRFSKRVKEAQPSSFSELEDLL